MSEKNKNKIVTILFAIIIILSFFINIIKKDEIISIAERRKLEQFPSVSISQIINGTFFNKFDKYVTDQFFERELFRKIKINTELKLLSKKNYNNLYEYNNYIIEQIYPLNEKSILNISNKIIEIKEKYLTENNKIYYSIIPDKNYFINKDNLKIDYNNLENILNEKLNFGKYIRIFDLLQLEDYYKTDSHWKQEKLIKIAQKFGQEMKLNLNNNYEEKIITEFKGVYSGQLPINEEKDEIKILTNNVLKNCTVYNYEKNEATTIYNFDKMNSLDKYDIYLSGAVSLISIENTENKIGKELVVFRDSFASSFVPLLVEGYDKITLIDTRYISPKILSQYIEFNNQDILFLYSTSIINNSYTLFPFFNFIKSLIKPYT